MDLVTAAKVERINELAQAVLADSYRRHRTEPEETAELGALGLTARQVKQYSILKLIRVLLPGSMENPYERERAAFELECSQELAKRFNRELSTSVFVPNEIATRPLDRLACTRAMATQPGSKGGALVNVENMGFVDVLRNRSVAIAMGARVISGLTGNGVLVRQTGKPTITWQSGEGTSTTAGDQALGQLSMTPRTVSAVTDCALQLLRQTSHAAESFVMSDLASDLAIDGLDNAIINGTGGGQPLGIKNVPGVTTGQDAATANYAKVLAFTSQAGNASAIKANPGFVTNTAGASVLMQRQRFTGSDSPLWEGSILDGLCVGFPSMSSEQIASGNLIFGSWGEVVIGEWGVLELAMNSSGTRFNQAQVGIRAMWMVDVLIRYPQAFVVSVNLS